MTTEFGRHPRAGEIVYHPSGLPNGEVLGSNFNGEVLWLDRSGELREDTLADLQWSPIWQGWCLASETRLSLT